MFLEERLNLLPTLKNREFSYRMQISGSSWETRRSGNSQLEPRMTALSRRNRNRLECRSPRSARGLLYGKLDDPTAAQRGWAQTGTFLDTNVEGYQPVGTSSVYWFARAALTKYHALGGLNNRNLFPHSSGG